MHLRTQVCADANQHSLLQLCFEIRRILSGVVKDRKPQKSHQMQSDEKEDNDCYLRGQLVEPTGNECHSGDRSSEMRDLAMRSGSFAAISLRLYRRVCTFWFQKSVKTRISTEQAGS